MSVSRPSVFDVLKSNASNAFKKNKKKMPKRSSPSKPPVQSLIRNSPLHQEINTRKRKPPVQSLTPNSPLPLATENHQEISTEKKMKRSSFNQTGSGNPDSSKKYEILISPDESLLELKKKSADFDVKRAVYWGEGERVPFMFVAKALDAIKIETGRIAMTEIACNLLRTVMETTPDDLLPVVYLLATRIAPAHEGLELGIGDALITKALAETFGTTQEHLNKKYKELAKDLGLVAKAIRSSQRLMRKPEALTVLKVFDTFHLIAKESGNDSKEKKNNHIKTLLVAATGCEPQYLIYLLQAAEIVKQVYSVIPEYDKIVPALVSGGVWNLPKACSFTLGIPVRPMSAKPMKGVPEIMEKFQDMEFTCEYKYDGERAQIHYMENGSVGIYSRNGEQNTGKFPDVIAAVTRLKKPTVTSFVLDCEIVAYDREKQKIQPFEILRKRARKNVVMSDIKVEVRIFAFDILYLNGQLLLQEQLNVRREHLYNSFQEEPGFFQFATAITSNDLEEIQTFLDDAVNSGCEGLIIKTLNKDATYEPSKRSNNWIKLKKDYMDSIGDSLDLVPIAAFNGLGKRTGSGFSEAVLEELSASLRSKVIPKPKSYYRYSDSDKKIIPDVWLEPSEVWEVKAAGLTISAHYRAAIGIVHPVKGISMRFPRFLGVREDKNIEQASSSDMVADMYNAQKNIQKDERDENVD
ncbi:hypothetical protein DH2020_017009 [Rehmannia glutinosa]|uniref:DNA ligase n=1 Tax=Rehmannia glutinosa TaxID=99300 RepID=A0ABR0WQS3_REHGL